MSSAEPYLASGAMGTYVTAKTLTVKINMVLFFICGDAETTNTFSRTCLYV